MDNYKFYVINLARSKERWKDMLENYEGDQLVRIEGYDGKCMEKYNDIKYGTHNARRRPDTQELGLGELGCCLSHIKAIKKAYDDGLDEVFIIEDDILNTYKNKWVFSLSEVIEKKPNGAECITFFTNNLRLNEAFTKTSHLFSPRNNSVWSTGVYYINRSGMKKICRLFVENDIINLEKYKTVFIADHNLLYPYMNTYHYTNPTFIDKMQDSIIQSSTHIERIHLPNHNFLLQYFKSCQIYNKYT
tara:strand:+ start:956 stop:1693 length:738 start_codon:yes stop_codon:yes gene_type:complete